MRGADGTSRVLVADRVAARIAAGMTQRGVAERMSGTKSVVSRLESGVRTRPTLTTIARYARAVGAVVEIRVRTRRQGSDGVVRAQVGHGRISWHAADVKLTLLRRIVDDGQHGKAGSRPACPSEGVAGATGAGARRHAAVAFREETRHGVPTRTC